MPDFTSALYLGFGHPSAALRPWERLTTGRPAALVSPPEALELGGRLAALGGAQRGTLGRSTLHLFWDLPNVWSDLGLVVYLDAGTYAMGRWAAERAAARGSAVRSFPHHDAGALRRAMRHERRRPVVVADGFCPGCGRLAPAPDYLDTARSRDGLVVLDDTQALGVLGAGPDVGNPYGYGGGGCRRWWPLDGPDVVTVSSLAKGLGAPVAVLTGSAAFVERFEALSDTRVYTSPPSRADLRAAEHALELNTACGDRLREVLRALVRRFHRRLAESGLTAEGGCFPVQTVRLPRSAEPITVHARLAAMGIHAVLQRPHDTAAPRVSFLFTAAHRPADVDRAVKGLALAGGT